MGNVVNRVFDSSGPEGKVRGTPQQIIEKYNQLARDAHLSGDRVAAENFQQHAEHYTRMLAAAQKDQDAKREQQDREHRERQQSRAQQQQGQGQQGQGQQQGQHHHKQPQPMAGDGAQPDVVEVKGGDSGLVETPEAAAETPVAKPAPAPVTAEAEEAPAPKPARKPRTRTRAKAKAPTAEDAAPSDSGEGEQSAAQ